MRTVGEIGIDVRPDASKFNEELKRKLREAEKRNKLEIPVHPKRDATTNTKLRETRDEIQDRIDNGNIKLRVPLAPEKRDAVRQTKTIVREVNEQLRGGNVKLLVPLGIDAKALVRDLKNEIKKAQAQIDDQIKVTIKVELDREKVKRDWRDLKHDLSGDKVELKADLDNKAEVRAELANLTRNRIVDLVVRINKRSLATAQSTLAALTGENLLRRAGLALENFATNLDTIAFKVAKVGIVGSTLASTVLATTSSISGLASSLGQLGGYALLLPALGASVVAFGTVMFASFQGFKDAVGGDVQALRQLPAEAQSAARALQGTWTEMQQPIQKAFWSQMSGAFEDLVRVVFPQLREGLTQVGTQAGNMSRQFLGAFTAFGARGAYASMFKGLARGVQEASVGVGAIVTSTLRLGQIGSAYLPDLGRYFTEISQTFEAWVNRSAQSGAITRWIDNARTSAGNLGRALVGIKGTFSAIVGTAVAGGAGNIGTFADAMERVRRTAESPVFRDTMTNLFAGAHEAIGLVKDGLGDLGRALYVLAPTLRSVMSISGETIGNVISSLAEAVKGDRFNSGLIEFFQGVRDGLEGMFDFLPKVAEGLGNLGALLGAVVANFGPVIGQLFGDVSGIFSELAPALKALVPIFANFSANALGGLADALALIAVPVRILLEFFGSLPGMVQSALIALLLLKRFTAGGVASVTGPLVQGLRQVPTAADKARESLKKPLGDTFLSPRAFQPGLEALRAIPGAVQAAFRGGLTGSAPGATWVQQQARAFQAAVAQQTPRMVSAGRELPKAIINSATGPAVLREFGPRIQGMVNSAFSSLPRLVNNSLSRQNAAITRNFTNGFLPSSAISDLQRKVATDVGKVNFSPAVSAMLKRMDQVGAQQAPSAFRSLTTGLATAARDAATQASTAMRSALSSRFPAALREGFAVARGYAGHFGADIKDEVNKQFRGLGTGAVSAITNDLRARFSGIKAVVAGPVANDMRAVGTAAANAFKTGFGAVKSFGSNFVTPMIKPAFDQARTLAGTTGRQIATALSDGMKSFRGATAGGGIATALRSDFRAAVDQSRTIGQSISTNIRTGLSNVASAGNGAMNGLVSGMRSAASAGTAAFKGLFSFLGGGWGVAFAAGFVIMGQMQQNARQLEAANKAVETSYRNIAQAALAAGEGIDGMAASRAQLDRLNELSSEKASSTFLGFGKNVSVRDLIKESGLSDQAFIDLMNGTGNKAAEAYVDGMSENLSNIKATLSGGGPVGWLTNLIAGGDLDAGIAAFDGIANSAEESNKELDRFWQTDVGRAQGIAGALDKIAKGGEKVNFANIEGIRSDIFGNLIGNGEKFTQYATGFAQSMGGSAEDTQGYFKIVNDSLKEYKASGKSLQTGDPIDQIVKNMVKAKVPVSAIKSGLEAFGYSAEAAAEKITFVWGPVTDKFGKSLTVLGEKIPKLGEAGNGMYEFSKALGAAANIDIGKVQQAVLLGGTDPAGLAKGLVEAGAGMDQVRSAIEAIGSTGSEASSAIAAAMSAAGKIAANGGLNPDIAYEFAAALDAIRDSAGGAAEAGGELFKALDLLQGGKLDSGDIAIQFADAKRAIEAWGTAAEDGSTKWGVLSEALNESNGNLDFSVKGMGEVKKGLEDLSKGALASAVDAYDKEIQASGDSVKARQKVSESIQTLLPTLDGMRAKLTELNGGVEISDQAWNAFLETVNLTPEEIQLAVLAQTDGAVGKLAELALKLDEVDSGKPVTIEADALTQPAMDKLKELGFIVKAGPDGTYTVQTSADPATAQAQLAAFAAFLQTTPIVAPIEPKISVPTNLGAIMGAEIRKAFGFTPITADIGANTAPALGQIGLLNGTPVEASASAEIQTAIANILGLNGTPVTADAGADTGRATGDINALNGTQIIADAGADINRALGNILGLNGTQVIADAGANVNRALGDIFSLNGTFVLAAVGGDTSAAQSAINSLNGQSVMVYVQAAISGAAAAIQGLFSADGNLVEPHRPGRAPKVKAFANGGVENHRAHIANTLRIFAEPETGGEAYIPLSPAKRARSVEILTEVASRFGYALLKANKKATQYEDGGVASGSAQVNTAGKQVNIIQHFPVTEKDSVAVLRAGQIVAAMG